MKKINKKTIIAAVVAMLSFSACFAALGSDSSDAAAPSVIASGHLIAGEWILYDTGLLWVDMKGVDLTSGYTIDPWTDYAELVTSVEVTSTTPLMPSGNMIDLLLLEGFSNMVSFSYHHSIFMFDNELIGCDALRIVRITEVDDVAYYPPWGVTNWSLPGLELDANLVGPLTTFIIDTPSPMVATPVILPGRTLILTDKAVNLPPFPFFYGFDDDGEVVLLEGADRAGRVYTAGLHNLFWMEVAKVGPEPEPDKGIEFMTLLGCILAALLIGVVIGAAVVYPKKKAKKSKGGKR